MSRLHVRHATLLSLTLGCGGSASMAGVDGGADAALSDAAITDGGSDRGVISLDAACAPGSQEFGIRAVSGNGTPFHLSPAGSCGPPSWLSIARVDDPRQYFPVTRGLCATDCKACQPMACPAICELPQPLGDAGADLVWDGTYFTPGQCGAQSLGCESTVCASAGNYIAQICGYGTSLTCDTFSFTWPPAPGAPPIVAYVGGMPNDGGAD